MKLFVVYLALLLANVVQAETVLFGKKELTVLIPEIEGWTGKGSGDKNHHFVNYLSSNIDLFNIDIVRVPPARAIALFNRMESGCFLGADPQILNLYVGHKLKFFKMMDSHLFALALKGSAITEISSSSRLAAIRGFDAKRHLPAHESQIIAEYNDIGQAIKMLDRNRVEAFLFWDVLPETLSKKLKVIGGVPLRTDDVGLNCIDTSEGADLVAYLTNNYLPPNQADSLVAHSK